MSLRDQLDAKAARRLFVPIPITDPGEDARRAAVDTATRLQLAKLANVQGSQLEELQARADAAAAVIAEHSVSIELKSMPPSDWEALTAAHLMSNGDDIDWRAMLPIALAASCVDESLEDPAWWASKLDDEGWTAGDVSALRRAIVQLNQWTPAAQLPKG